MLQRIMFFLSLLLDLLQETSDYIREIIGNEEEENYPSGVSLLHKLDYASKQIQKLSAVLFTLCSVLNETPTERR